MLIIALDVLEFLQDLNVHDLPQNLQERYHKLLQDVTSVFEDDGDDIEGNNDDTGYEEELVDSSTPERFGGNPDEDTDDSSFVHFNTSKTSISGFGNRYPTRGKAEFENDDLYDETNLNQDYEPVKFGEWSLVFLNIDFILRFYTEISSLIDNDFSNIHFKINMKIVQMHILWSILMSFALPNDPGLSQ